MLESPALTCTGLNVIRGKRHVVRDVSLRAEYGALHALVGPNGAGKSSLLKALVGVLPVTGTLHIAGRDHHTLAARARANLVGYVPQQSLLQSGLRVREVVQQGRYAALSPWARLGKDVAPEVALALARTQLAALAERPFNTLSGGEQRRVLIARALATGARILLLDEPTAGLDVGHVLRLFALLKELTRDGYAVIAVLHDLADVVRYADTLTLLCAGETLACGCAPSALDHAAIHKAYGVRISSAHVPVFSLDGGLS